jgi:ATP-binding cassette subfamily B protein/subfamily B ATP-binding cassette protein MsbA
LIKRYREHRRQVKARSEGAWVQWKSAPKVLPFLRPFRGLVVFSFVLTVFSSVIALAEPWPLALIIDSVLGTHAPPGPLQNWFGQSPDPYRLLIFIVVLGFLISTVSHGVRVINDYVNAKVEQNMVLDLRGKLFAHCESLSLTFHDSRQTGMLMSIINLQSAAVGAIVMAFPPLLESLLMLIGMLIIAILIDWQVTLVSLMAVPMIYWALSLYGTRIVPRVIRVTGLEWRSLSIVFEAMSMLRVIVSFGRERHEHRRFMTQGKTAVDARVRLTVWQTLFSLGVTTATAAGTAAVLGFGAWHVLQNKITLGELTVLISYIASVYQPLESISNTVGHLHQQFFFFNAVLNTLKTKPEVRDAPDAKDVARARGEIEFEDVSFAYQGRVDTLQNISFHVNAGQRVAIVGPTGAGKTTLASLLVRFYDPAHGAIKIDGYDIRKIKLQSLRNQLSLVLQEPMLFSGSIADNIRYGRLGASTDEIVEAARAANAHDFIERLPDGYDTELGEGGKQLSGGERQRICVARAFIRNAPILILDEPTSSIDSKTELVILDALDRLMEGRTSLMIAHRLSTVRKADLIVVMNRGRVAETGSHEELLVNGGLYYQLYEAQNGEVAKIEADHLRRQLEGQPAAITTNGDGDGHGPANGDGDAHGTGLDREVLDSLARAVRQRIRSTLANGGAHTTTVSEQAADGGHQPSGNGHPPEGNGHLATPNGEQPGDDISPPPEADRGPTP